MPTDPSRSPLISGKHPRSDELRSFFHVRYEVLKPLVIEDAQAHFRFLSLTSAIQRLRFTRFAASGTDDLEIDFSQSPFPGQGTCLCLRRTRTWPCMAIMSEIAAPMQS